MFSFGKKKKRNPKRKNPQNLGANFAFITS